MVWDFGTLCHMRCRSGWPRIKACPSCKVPRAGLVHMAITIPSASGLSTPASIGHPDDLLASHLQLNFMPSSRQREILNQIWQIREGEVTLSTMAEMDGCPLLRVLKAACGHVLIITLSRKVGAA